MLSADSINFYAALREMETSSNPFSVTWCTHSESKKTGGNLHTETSVLFAGKKETDDYELMFFKRTDDDQVVSCHLFSLMFFNGQKMVIE